MSYRVRHRVQQRNQYIADRVDLFFTSRDDVRLRRFGDKLSTGERVMLLVYLIANDFAGTAREFADEWGISLTTALSTLDRENGAEAALALGWVR